MKSNECSSNEYIREYQQRRIGVESKLTEKVKEINEKSVQVFRQGSSARQARFVAFGRPATTHQVSEREPSVNAATILGSARHLSTDRAPHEDRRLPVLDLDRRLGSRKRTG